MLEAILRVNRREIDRLKIFRIEDREDDRDNYTYRCRHSGELWIVTHNYSDGAFELVRKAIAAMPKEAKDA